MQSALKRDSALALLELERASTRAAALSPATCHERHISDHHAT